MNKIKCLLAICLVFPLFGCSYDKELDEYQGRFVDINSDVYLLINRNKMKVVFNDDFHEEYKVSVKKEGDHLYIACKDGGGFGGMSELQIRGESLVAYEMVLDDDGHRYEFVREEVKAKKLEVVDVSEDLPKEFASDKIARFSLSFSTTKGRSYDLDDSWPKEANYSIVISQDEDGRYELDYHESYPSYIGRRFMGEIDQGVVEELYQMLKGNGVFALNGYCLKNDANKPSLSLYVTFDDDEELIIRGEGDGANECPFALMPIMELFVPFIGECE